MTAWLTFVVLLFAATCVAGETPTHSSADSNSSPAINTLRKQIQAGSASAVKAFWAAVSRTGTPLIEPIPDERDFWFVTFLWRGDDHTRNVVIFDGVAGFDAKDQMIQLAGTDVWYKTYRVRNDARFAYNLSPSDSLQSFDDVKGDEQMQKRLAMLEVDPLNPRRCPTTFGAHGAESSYVEMRGAATLVWESPVNGIQRGRVDETSIRSTILKNEKKIWVYTPAGFARTGERYPLLVLFDGDRNVLWIPKILDILIAQAKIPPLVAVTTDQSARSARGNELTCNPHLTEFLAKELAPWSRDKYHTTIQPQRNTVAGSSFGGLASVCAALKHPEMFGNVISLSGSFWWKPQGDTKGEWLRRQVGGSAKRPLHFYLEVRLMEDERMQIEPNRRMAETLTSKGYALHYSEYDGGHAFLNWSEGIAMGLQYFFGAKKTTTDASILATLSCLQGSAVLASVICWCPL